MNRRDVLKNLGVVGTGSIALANTACSAADTGASVPDIDFRDRSFSPAQRAKALINQMTLEEAAAQLNCPRAADVMADPAAFQVKHPYFEHGIGGVYSASLDAGPEENAKAVIKLQEAVVERSRFGIPAFIYEECLHGLLATGATQFPQAITMACAFNPKLVEEVFSATASEAKARGSQACFSPNLDVCTDPRWGRSEETWGEDPYVISVAAKAIVTGLQGPKADYLQNDKIATSVKHFAGYGQGIGGRNFAPSHIGPVELQNVTLAPFRAAVNDAGALGLMASHGEIDGVPAHADVVLLNDILREDWGFAGYVVSDWDDVRRIHSLHGVAASEAEAATMALKAGVDIELANNGVYMMLPQLVRDGAISETFVRRAAERILYAKFKCGLFDLPFAQPAEAKRLSRSTEHRALALKMAEESAILLKNENNLLPLDPNKSERILVVGPNAASVHLGGYSPKPFVGVSLLEGLRAYAEGKSMSIDYALGCEVTVGGEGTNEIETDADDTVSFASAERNRELITEAVAAAKNVDTIILAVGGNESTAQEAYFAGDSRGDRDDLDLFGQQNELAEALLELGKPVITVLIHGRPLSPQLIAAKCPAILDAFYPGEEGGHALAKILFGDVNPSGKLPLTLVRNVGQIPGFYYQQPTGRFRNYVDSDSTPLFPFGHGLSYTRFDVGAPQASPNEISVNGSVKVYVTVKNIGRRSGKEVVQLYVRDDIASRARPIKLLRGFKKVALEPGEERRVEFTLGPEDFGFRNAEGELLLEPGRIILMSGANSEDLKQSSLHLRNI
ncbi:glycoside hydrolase family 3 N-terminal domain-containing protein [Fretibacter rubidus]|uniref:glycoside hydrolase family 3 N-terminal domain-containing protein n=1 Tax=Fretibacter rubidus TaxID=570162 RepID=UPI00352A701F